MSTTANVSEEIVLTDEYCVQERSGDGEWAVVSGPETREQAERNYSKCLDRIDDTRREGIIVRSETQADNARAAYDWLMAVEYRIAARQVTEWVEQPW